MSYDDHMKDVDRVLEEVRQAMSWSEERREINELKALQMLLEVTKTIHDIRDTNELVTFILDSMVAFADGDRAFLMLMDDNGALRFKMGRDSHHQYLSADQFTPSTGVIEKTLEKGGAVVVPDAQTDESLKDNVSIQQLQLRTVMCSPLMVKSAVLGLLYVDGKRAIGRYSRAHLNVVASLADQAALAIRNAKKFETHS